MYRPQLDELRTQLLEQDTYEQFQKMLMSQEPFVPTYHPPVSHQSSAHMHSFTNHYSS